MQWCRVCNNKFGLFLVLFYWTTRGFSVTYHLGLQKYFRSRWKSSFCEYVVGEKKITWILVMPQNRIERLIFEYVHTNKTISHEIIRATFGFKVTFRQVLLIHPWAPMTLTNCKTFTQICQVIDLHCANSVEEKKWCQKHRQWKTFAPNLFHFFPPIFGSNYYFF